MSIKTPAQKRALTGLIGMYKNMADKNRLSGGRDVYTAEIKTLAKPSRFPPQRFTLQDIQDCAAWERKKMRIFKALDALTYIRKIQKFIPKFPPKF